MNRRGFFAAIGCFLGTLALPAKQKPVLRYKGIKFAYEGPTVRYFTHCKGVRLAKDMKASMKPGGKWCITWPT